MALLYTGRGDLLSVSIGIYGDGASKTVNIDLSKNPFGLDFAPKFPAVAYLTSHSPNPVSVTISGSILTVTFESPPPFTDPLNPLPAGRQVAVGFLYEA